MLIDKDIHALFADPSESDPPKKEEEEKPKPKAKTDKKPRSTKKKTKITFDPDIFLDGINDNDNTNNEPEKKNDNFNIQMLFPTKESFTFLPEFANLAGRVTFYLNSQLHYLLDDFINELIQLVDTSPKENEIVENFLNEILDSIKDLFYLDDEDSNNFSNPYTPESFDLYADRFRQSFLEANKYSQITYNTANLKSIRKEIRVAYDKIKKNFQAYPELFQTEINELSMSQNNYDTLLNTRKTQAKSQKNREVALSTKIIEQDIFLEYYSKRIEHFKDEKAKYSHYFEINEMSKITTADKISDTISTLKDSIINERKGYYDQLVESEKKIRNLKKNLKHMRAQYQYQHQCQMSVAFSCIQDEENNQHISNSFLNQKNSFTSMNLTNLYNQPNSSLIQQSQISSNKESQNKSRDHDYSCAKIQKTFNSILKEQNKSLENTSEFIRSVKDTELSNLIHRSYLH